MANLAWPALLALVCGALSLLWTATLDAELGEGRPAQAAQSLGAAGLLVAGGVGSLLVRGEAIQMLLGGWQLNEGWRREIRCFPTCGRGRVRQSLTWRVAENGPAILLLFDGVLLASVRKPLPRLLKRGLNGHRHQARLHRLGYQGTTSANCHAQRSPLVGDRSHLVTGDGCGAAGESRSWSGHRNDA